MRFTIGLLLIASLLFSCEQQKEKAIVKGNIKESKVNALFAGGREAFKDYLENQMRLPKPAEYFGVNAFVDVEIVFDTAGRIRDVGIKKVEIDADKAPKEALTNGLIPLNEWFGAEASRLMWLSMNKWKPAEQLGKEIAAKQMVTIYFESPQYVLNHREEQVKYGQLMPDYAKNHALLFFESGTYLITEKQWKGAEQQLTFATQLVPNYTDAWYNLGIVHTQLKNPKAACECWMIAAELGDVEAEQLVLDNCRTVVESLKTKE